MLHVNLEKIKKAYFIGIGGIGQSAVARMLLLEGKEVFGSDMSASEVTTELARLGAKVRIGSTEDIENSLPEEIDVVIYTVAIPENHPELLEVKQKGIPVISYPEALGLISKDKFTIAVAGTHGKTTTTAMIAHILVESDFDPTVIVGSLMHDPAQDRAGSRRGKLSNFISGKSKYFVVEACEYKRSFLNLQPNIAVITNIDEDHLDYYKTLSGVQDGFRDFLSNVKKDGLVVTDISHEKIQPVIEGGAGFRLADYPAIQADIVLKIPGQHNIQNAKAAIAVADALGVPREKSLAALANFNGTWRRFERKGETENGVVVFDDYAHHPSEIHATLLGAREMFPKERIVVAFQPHLYSRTKEHIDEFSPAFAPADEILILPIYAAREPKDLSISSEILVEKMKKSGLNAHFVKDFETAEVHVAKNLKKGDVLFTMGAGDVNTLAKIILA